MHPLVWIVVPVVALFLGVELVGFVRRGTWGASRELPYANAVLSLTAGALFVVWIARFAGAFGGPVSS